MTCRYSNSRAPGNTCRLQYWLGLSHSTKMAAPHIVKLEQWSSRSKIRWSRLKKCFYLWIFLHENSSFGIIPVIRCPVFRSHCICPTGNPNMDHLKYLSSTLGIENRTFKYRKHSKTGCFWCPVFEWKKNKMADLALTVLYKKKKK